MANDQPIPDEVWAKIFDTNPLRQSDGLTGDQVLQAKHLNDQQKCISTLQLIGVICEAEAGGHGMAFNPVGLSMLHDLAHAFLGLMEQHEPESYIAHLLAEARADDESDGS